MVDEVETDAREAARQLEYVRRHLEYRMDEWYNNYANYKNVEDRKIAKAKRDGFNDGFDEGKVRGEQDARKKIAKEEYEKQRVAMNITQVTNHTELLDKRLVEVGIPHDAEITNYRVLDNVRKEIPNNYKPIVRGYNVYDPNVYLEEVKEGKSNSTHITYKNSTKSKENPLEAHNRTDLIVHSIQPRTLSRPHQYPGSAAVVKSVHDHPHKSPPPASHKPPKPKSIPLKPHIHS